MKCRIETQIFDQFPEYKVGVIVAHGIDQSRFVATSQDYQPRLDTPVYQNWVEAFAQVKLPVSVKPAHLALAERWQKDGQLRQILPLVDFFNHCSLQYQRPIGAHDLAGISGEMTIRLTQDGDTFFPRNSTKIENVETGIPAYTSGQTVLTKNWIWRQGQTSAVNPQTQSVIIPIDVLSETSETELGEITNKIAREVEQKFGAQTQVFILSRTQPSCEWKEESGMTNTITTTTELLTRGVSQILPNVATLAKRMEAGPLRLYLGIDPTGSLLHLGHAVVLRKLNQFAQAGHQVILLIGNGTVRIGDPTGRDSSRPVLTDEMIKQNFETWKDQAQKVLDFSKIEIRYNGDWLDKLSYADIVKLMAQTTVQQLIERDMFQDRLQKGLPIFGHEIMYPLLQGYDSVAMDVDLELGGTDQTFNMMMGRHLQRVYNNREKWVLTTPIINGTDGRKMSKTFGNFVALTDEPSEMFGKLMSVVDEQIDEYFMLLTDVPATEVQAMRTAMQSGANPMEFKKKLAWTITADLHNQAAADQAQAHFEKTVQEGAVPDEIPSVTVKAGQHRLLDLLKQVWPDESSSNLRRLIEQKAVELLPSGEKPDSPYVEVDSSTIEIIRLGKRRYARLENE